MGVGRGTVVVQRGCNRTVMLTGRGATVGADIAGLHALVLFARRRVSHRASHVEPHRRLRGSRRGESSLLII